MCFLFKSITLKKSPLTIFIIFFFLLDALPSDMACDTYQSTNWYADFWLWNNRQSAAFTLETATVPPQSLMRIRNNGVAIARGIYLSLKNQLTGIQTVTTEIPGGFSLSQNYPNPFNPVTNFEFQIADFGSVKLEIFDALGRKIETLVDSRLKPGTYRVDWSAAKYPTGIYFYELRTKSFTKTKKMVLVK